MQPERNVCPEARALLQQHWGYPDFLPLDVYDLDALHRGEKKLRTITQEDIIDDLIQQAELCREGQTYRDLFVTASTGAGKSVMFQIPAIDLAEKYGMVTLVISPLIGLMNDQVQGMEKHRYAKARTINSDIPPMVKKTIAQEVQEGRCDILYLSPESLLSRSDISDLVGDRAIGLLIVDEAHIMTTWGKQFRPDYWFLGDYVNKLRKQHLNGSHPGWMVPAQPQDGSLKLPQNQHPLSASVYADAVRKLKECLPDLQPKPEWINSLLGLLETQFSRFPSSTFTGESPDVSLFDHAKTTAAMGACISAYVQANDITDLHKALFEQEADFRQKDAFLLYTADFSRIQKFLYTVHTENALRSLRSRSFFLELLMEHYLDELLTGCGVSRANLIYSGGGHCYALLPNTPAVIQTVTQWNHNFNRWLRQEFGTQLFLANAWTACSGNDLTNTPAEKSPYKELFRRVNRLLEQHKFHRYTADDLRQLNSTAAYSDGRECKVCGTSANLKDDLCPWCRLFVELSIKIQKKNVLVVSRQASDADDCTLPALDGGREYLALTDPISARKRLATGEPIVRVYTKNAPFTGLTYSTNLYVGDYAASNSMEELAEQSQGVHRIAVCRMDVDNLGHAFISGFEQENEADPVKRMHYVTLSRTSAFSRQMSLFFKCYINGILEGLQVSIVYAGGDDVFLVGAWNDVLEAAQRIQSNFTAFSCGALTLSAGIGIFDDHYPIRLSAEETAELEESAKHLPGKNAVALFTPERKAVRDAKGNLLVRPEQGHIYSWGTFRAKVLDEKVGCLQSFFGKDDSEHGNAMLYNLLALLREAENDRINLARYAYLLARLSPKKSAPNYKLYEQFSHSMMDWALDAVQRHQLITAVYIYVYQNRKGVDTDGRME